MQVPQIKRVFSLPTWARVLLLGYCLWLVGEILLASSWHQAVWVLAAGLLEAPVGIAVVFAALGFWLYDPVYLLIRGVRTTATIEGYSIVHMHSDMRRYAIYRYRPLDGDEMTNTSCVAVVFERGVGTEVTVRYDPKDPRLVAGLRLPVLRTLVGLSFCVLGTGMVVGSVIAGLRVL